jgi:acyl-CoA hydrolase
MEIEVEVVAEDLMTGETRTVARSYVIYVALDDKGKPTPVPPLVPANAQEQAKIEEALLRRRHMQEIDAKLAQIREETSHSRQTGLA